MCITSPLLSDLVARGHLRHRGIQGETRDLVASGEADWRFVGIGRLGSKPEDFDGGGGF